MDIRPSWEFTGGSEIRTIGSVVIPEGNVKSISRGTQKLWQRVPFEYVEVEYIECHGTEYIDTGVKNNTIQNHIFEMGFETGKSIGESFQNLFGCSEATTSTDGGFYAYLNANSKIALAYGDTGSNPVSESLVIERNSKHVFRFEQNTAIVDSEIIGTSRSGSSFGSLNIWVLARNSKAVAPSVGKLYYAKLYDGTTIKRNFIPVYSKNTDEYGMYDTVTRQFYGNAGTGAFTGPVVLPDNYQKIDSIMPKYEGAYIDTGIAANTITKITMDYQFRYDFVAGDIRAAFGARNANNQGIEFISMRSNKQDGHFINYYSTEYNLMDLYLSDQSWEKFNSGITVVSRYEATHDRGIAEVNFKTLKVTHTTPLGYSITKSIRKGSGSNITQNLFIFATNRNGSPWMYDKNGSKMYGFKIEVNDQLVRDFVPIKNTDTNEVGLYDLVGRRFYGSPDPYNPFVEGSD